MVVRRWPSGSPGTSSRLSASPPPPALRDLEVETRQRNGSLSPWSAPTRRARRVGSSFALSPRVGATNASQSESTSRRFNAAWRRVEMSRHDRRPTPLRELTILRRRRLLHVLRPTLDTRMVSEYPRRQGRHRTVAPVLPARFSQDEHRGDRPAQRCHSSVDTGPKKSIT